MPSIAPLVHANRARACTISGSRERDGAFLLLVEEHIGTRYPEMVIDSDLDVFPASDAWLLQKPERRHDAVARWEATELFDVEMAHNAGVAPTARGCKVG